MCIRDRPRTAEDVYNEKLQAGTHKPALVSTRDEDVEREVQTDDLGEQDKFNQAPDDQYMTSYMQEREFVSKKQRKEQDALSLDQFMARAGPVMEQLIIENTELRQ